MAGVESNNINMERGAEGQKGGRGKSKDLLVSMEARLDRMENAVIQFDTRLEEDVVGREDLKAVVDELQDRFHGALNTMADVIRKEAQVRLDHMTAELTSLHEEMKDMKGDWALCKEAALNKSHGPREVKVMDSFKPKSYDGKREAKELDTFLWSVEGYFKCLRLEDDESKISTASMFLTDNALMWWRRRSMEIDEGTFSLNTWNDFKTDIMLHFYPQNAKYEAKEKLRWLKQTGSVKDYVNDFVSLLFEVPNMPEEDKLMYFMSGLQNWAKLELQRRHVQNLSDAIAAAESLIEFKTNRQGESKFKGKESNDEKGGGDDRPKEKDKNGDKPEPSKPKEKKGRYDKTQGKIWQPTCYLCDGPHMMRDCPKKKALNALTLQEEKGEEDAGGARMGCIRLLNAVKATVAQSKGQASGGSMYVDVKVGDKTSRVLVDTGATHNFMTSEEANRLGLRVAKEPGSVKTVNTAATPIVGVARNVEVRIGAWKGKVDFTVVKMDDYGVVLGLEFMDKVRAFSVPFCNILCIMADGEVPCVVPVERQARGKTPHLSSMQLLKSWKKGEPTFLTTVKKEVVERKSKPLPRPVEAVREKVSDEKPKELQQRSEVDHAIELELGAKPHSKAPYGRKVPFGVLTNASDFAISDVLMQERHQVAGKSRKLNDTEGRNSVHEKEMTAIAQRKTNVVAGAPNGRVELSATVFNPQSSHMERIREGLPEVPQVKNLVELVEVGKARRFWLEDKRLCNMRKRLFVPRWDDLRRRIPKNLHDATETSHLGVHRRDWAKLLGVAQFPFKLQRLESIGRSPSELADGQQPLTSITVVPGYVESSPTARKTAMEWQVTKGPNGGEPHRDPPSRMGSFDKAAEGIHAKRMVVQPGVRKHVEYFVKWKGLPDSEATWEKEKSLWRFKDMIEAFEEDASTRTSTERVGEDVKGRHCARFDPPRLGPRLQKPKPDVTFQASGTFQNVVEPSRPSGEF